MLRSTHAHTPGSNSIIHTRGVAVDHPLPLEGPAVNQRQLFFCPPEKQENDSNTQTKPAPTEQQSKTPEAAGDGRAAGATQGTKLLRDAQHPKFPLCTAFLVAEQAPNWYSALFCTAARRNSEENWCCPTETVPRAQLVPRTPAAGQRGGREQTWGEDPHTDLVETKFN